MIIDQKKSKQAASLSRSRGRSKKQAKETKRKLSSKQSTEVIVSTEQAANKRKVASLSPQVGVKKQSMATCRSTTKELVTPVIPIATTDTSTPKDELCLTLDMIPEDVKAADNSVVLALIDGKRCPCIQINPLDIGQCRIKNEWIQKFKDVSF